MARARLNKTWAFGLGFCAFCFLLYVLDLNQGVITSQQPKEYQQQIEVARDEQIETVNRDGISAQVSEQIGFAKQSRRVKIISEFAWLVQKNNVVILTYASYGYRENLINWIVSLVKLGINNYGIVCLDEEIDKFLLQKDISCYSMWKYSNKLRNTKSSETRLSVKTVMKLWIIRLGHLRELLQAGLDVVFSDTDAIWLKNPLADGTGLLSSRMGDIVASRGKYPWLVANDWGATLCLGLAYFRSTSKVIRLVRSAETKAVREQDDQIGINLALFEAAKQAEKSPKDAKGTTFALLDSYGGLEESKLDFLEDRNAAVASIKDVRVLLIPHQVVPRCCNKLTDVDWRNSVQVAHCHPTDCVVARTRKENWGNFEKRSQAQRKYKLWCMDPSWEGLEKDKFHSWLVNAATTCFPEFSLQTNSNSKSQM